MNPIESAWSVLKMGVVLPDDAEEIDENHPAWKRQGHIQDKHKRYYSPEEDKLWDVPTRIGVWPDNPDDLYHGYSPVPFWSESSGGYHPDVHEQPDIIGHEEHQEVHGPGRVGVVKPEGENELKHTDTETLIRMQKDIAEVIRQKMAKHEHDMNNPFSEHDYMDLIVMQQTIMEELGRRGVPGYGA